MQGEVERWLKDRQRKILQDLVAQALESIPAWCRDAVRDALLHKAHLRRWEHGGFYAVVPFEDGWLPLDRAVVRLVEARAKESEGVDMERSVGDKVIMLVQGDITEMETDAIVNAANAQLVLGGGVAGAIRTKGGPEIQEECDRIGGTHVGGAVVTTGGRLKARWVIHAVGPRWGEGDEEEKLRQATLNSLRRATEKGMRSVAFPAISTGIFGFPKDLCAKIMLDTVLRFLAQEETSVERVVFCLWSPEDLNLFQETLQAL
ncbi:macro domain-containing protein [Desulfosoma caldarium]|uniref:O-acetyl-ADP-ribose deacetylase (Regulator of RNase III) n=1 Tax=Desulfosoma caldarium TaxID=610254 RepID=A0A3N1VIN4_9BACT|nr:macro domain-containing protein [Desulfosoma caldarium]ROR01770.1 O-acetyl-ADP-ribose deacetylase (regulator of RNase III) [Desulfosoma caldarium]